MAKYTGIEPQGPDEFFYVPIYLYGVYGVYRYMKKLIWPLWIERSKKNPIELGKRGVSCIFGLSIYSHI
jgi:hypothetical protein